MLRFDFETDADRPALIRLAERMRAKGAVVSDWPQRFYWNRLPGAPVGDDFPVRRRRLLAFEGEEVRGIQNFFEHELWVNTQEKPLPFVWANGLVTEALTNARYATIPAALLRNSLSRVPMHMAIGRVGTEMPMARLLIAARWGHLPLPVFALPVRSSVIAKFDRIASRPKLKLAANLAVALRITLLADSALAGLRRLRQPRNAQIFEMDRFGPWADEVWSSSQRFYKALTRRDAAALDRLYCPGDPRLIRLNIRRADNTLGWIALTIHDFVDDQDFGTCRIGNLADALAPPADASSVIALGVQCLVEHKADLIMGTFSHIAWITALRRIGFIRVPTTARFFASPAAATVVLHPATPLKHMHFTMGDCDGPLSVPN